MEKKQQGLDAVDIIWSTLEDLKIDLAIQKNSCNLLLRNYWHIIENRLVGANLVGCTNYYDVIISFLFDSNYKLHVNM